MPNNLRTRAAAIILFLLLGLPNIAAAQWQRVATNLFNPKGNGSLIYSNGIVWLASAGLWMSIDSGITWTQRTFPDPAAQGRCYDLAFFDRSTGLAACPDGAFLTTDQGVTWRNIRAGSPFGVTFGNTMSVIGVSEQKPNGVSVSGDGGITWKRTLLADYAFMIRAVRDGSLLTYCGNPGTGGNLYSTTDLGVTWQMHPGKADFDSFSFAVDSCDDNLLYLVNEDIGKTTDNLAQIFRTTDFGSKWSAMAPQPLPFYAGSIAIGYKALYVQTFNTNVFRSTDRGVTWTDIKGPKVDYDTRLIAAINDNIVLATDIFGNVWRTVNGGGDSILSNTLSLTQSSVTFPDTLTACDSASRSVVLAIASCGSPTLSNSRIVGPDSLHFLLESGHRADSLVALFTADSGRAYQATISLKLSDGTTQLLPLTGYGRSPVPLLFSTTGAANDTIGGTIIIPLTTNSALPAGDLTYQIAFDSSQLHYVGSYTKAEPSLDLTIGQSGNRATIRSTRSLALGLDLEAAYTVFQIFPQLDSCTTVLIDSIVLTRNSKPCGYSRQSLRAQVCAPIGCGTPLISGVLRYHAIPVLQLSPNPSNGETLLSSTTTIPQAHITIRDPLGRSITSFDQTIGPHEPCKLDMRLFPSGVYIISVRANGFSQSIRFLSSK